MDERPKAIEIGGAKYLPNREWSMACELWMMREIRAAGLDSLEIEPGMTPEQLVAKVTERGVDSGAMLTLLGGFLLPDGVKSGEWTEARAASTREALGGVTGKADKTLVIGAFAEMMVFFFHNGLVSIRTSPSSSSTAASPPPAPPPAAGTWTDETVDRMATGEC